MLQKVSQTEASLYRMVGSDHMCPFGLKAKALLERHGFDVNDQHLKSRAEVEAFKAENNVKTTPQVFIGGERIGGFEDLSAHLGQAVKGNDAVTYQPVIALFLTSVLIAVAVTWLVSDTLFMGQTVGWFVAIAMVLLGLQKLQNIEKFATMFLTYDLLAQRWIRYGYIYPFVEAGAGLLMLMGVLTWLSAPAVLIVAGIGTVSVFKAVYIDKRALKCACVGDSRVPLGFVSLTENLMMVGMALWMLT